MRLNPKKIAIDYYFGDLSPWKLPGIAATALEEGYDGTALRRLASLAVKDSKSLRAEDFEAKEIDSAFREMGVDAPVSEHVAQMTLAKECAANAMNGRSSVFDAATHVRVHLCHLSEPPEPLRRIARLSESAGYAPRTEWTRIETDLKDAFSDFLARCEATQRLASFGGSDPDAEAAQRRKS